MADGGAALRKASKLRSNLRQATPRGGHAARIFRWLIREKKRRYALRKASGCAPACGSVEWINRSSLPTADAVG